MKENISFGMDSTNRFIFREINNENSVVFEIYKNNTIHARMHYVNKLLQTFELFWEVIGVPKMILTGEFISEYNIQKIEEYREKLYYYPEIILKLKTGKHINFDPYYNETMSLEINE